ncbi:MAG: 3',5'-cyclic-AMP phosphodiesterase [Piscirickettsiaceae bacterium]|nr:MAG: 3',5'-cyclic-AMP phosphodiesterase [Piscirickettsiaceae bacterium]PCI69490.1 MAG: 3',5'-cyclic-AMP phosphodiesterase [Piscirickettsiaceae bacterium]
MNAFSQPKGNDADIRILQISDMHLFASNDQQLVGINTNDSFLAVLDLAKQHSWPPDYIFLTGDLSQDSSQAAYQRLVSHLEPLGIPCYVLPGNHDKADALRQFFAQEPVLYQTFVQTHDWLFAFLNTATPNEEGGTLDEQEILALEQQLKQNPHKNVLICLHHQLNPVKSQWLDTMAVCNPESLVKLVSTYSNIRGIIHGHVHQDFTSSINDTPIYSVPSTCFQFKPNSIDFAIDERAPGYRWLELSPLGEIKTSIVRLENIPSSLDYQSNGY